MNVVMLIMVECFYGPPSSHQSMHFGLTAMKGKLQGYSLVASSGLSTHYIIIKVQSSDHR